MDPHFPQDEKLELETVSEFQKKAQEAARQEPQEPGDQPRRRIPKLLLLLTIAVLALAGWETGATFLQHSAAPTARDWEQAAARIRQERRPDEPVIFAPRWVDPIGRLHLADQLTLDQVTLSDVDRFARVWQISTRGARHPWLAGARPTRRWDLGAVAVEVFDRTPQKVLVDFTRRLPGARVDRIGHKPLRCPWKNDHFACDPVHRWNKVSPYLAEVDHRPYRCIHAHPREGSVVRITFPAARIGQALVGYTGVADFENRKRSDEPVTLKVFIGPRLLGTIVHQNRWPWRRFDLDTRPLAGQTHPVRFEVTAKKAYARAFCFHAEARK